MDIDEQANFLEVGWAVISGAPFHFIAVCLIAAGIIYAVFHQLHDASFKNKDSTIETLRERLEWTEERRDEYKSKLSEYQSEYAEVKDKAPKRLRQTALALVSEIRTFLEKERREGDILHSRDWQEMTSATNEEDKKKLWNKFTASRITHSSLTSMEFERHFKVPAIVMRDELLTHLPEYSPEGGVHYEHPTNPIGMGMVADDLERMARLLEVS